MQALTGCDTDSSETEKNAIPGCQLLALALPDGGKEEDAQQQIALRALRFWGRPPNMR